ncbi:PAS domain-containing sensor histidine kinase [Granulicella arctica]|uniref:PAS domain-containing sensor histidine kinase n=1 Tax=Granulicella arctica TaxID=940613 RepID=UPI0021DFD938|nr:PAS domain-containing sensor histidine kinase [Granulicella arctica]
MRELEFFETHTMFSDSRSEAGGSATYLRALLENSPIAIVVLDAHHRYTMCNPAFERLFQYSPKELATANLDELIAGPEMVDEARRLSQQTLQGRHVHTVTQRRRRDAMMVDVEIYGIPLIVDEELVGVYGLYQDVTDRNKAQTAFRQISDRLENLQQMERRRLARDLHDSTSQELAVLNWNLTRLMNLVGDRDDMLKTLVQETKEIAYQCSTKIRSASYLLHPPLLGEGGLTVAVSWLAEGFEERSGIRVTLVMSADLGRFQDEVEIAIFRIVQESLANVLRHSGSPVVNVLLQRKEEWLELRVTDQGRGHMREVLLQARDSRSGVGISGMRERAEQLGGCLQISHSDEGTTIVASIPTQAGRHA